MRVDAIILARGGSKGIPGKNIMDFCGKPLLVWTIEQCAQSDLVNTVWVSSDSEEILEVARAHNAELIKRPSEFSGDTATSESGWLHALKYLGSVGVELDAVLAPQVTSPLRRVGDIDKAINKFATEKLDSLFSASMALDLCLWGQDHDCGLDSVNYDYRNRKRRQDLSGQIIENGSFYLFKPDVLMKEGNRFGGRMGYSGMDLWQMFEIDHVDDVRVCSALMNEFILR